MTDYGVDKKSAIARHLTQNSADAHVRMLHITNYYPLRFLIPGAMDSYKGLCKVWLDTPSCRLEPHISPAFAPDLVEAARSAFSPNRAHTLEEVKGWLLSVIHCHSSVLHKN